MKRIATAALAVCLLSGTAALAQPPNNNNGNHNNGNHNNGGHNNGGHNNGGPNNGGPNNGGRNNGGPNNGGQPNFGPQVQRFQGGPQNGQNNNPQVYQRNQGGPQVYRNFNGGPQGFRPQFGAPGFRPGGQRPRYSPQFFPRVFNPGARFHWRGGFWRGPPGWYYHSWFYGQILPYGWFAPDWWINDYWYYDLPVPPYGYEWVRNGPDALLVNIDTGFVAEVVPGIFY
jgi:Ni/Co efflux regulator RcnB